MSPPHWLSVTARLYVRRRVVSNSCRTQSGGATPLRLYETTYLVFDRTYKKKLNYYTERGILWAKISDSRLEFHYIPYLTMHYLLLTLWYFFIFWINQLQQCTSSVSSIKLSNSTLRYYTETRKFPIINKLFWNTNICLSLIMQFHKILISTLSQTVVINLNMRSAVSAVLSLIHTVKQWEHNKY